MSAPMSRNTFKISIFIIIVKTGQQRQERRTGIKIFLYPNVIASSCEKLFIYQKQKMHQQQKPESFWTIKMKDIFWKT